MKFMLIVFIHCQSLSLAERTWRVAFKDSNRTMETKDNKCLIVFIKLHRLTKEEQMSRNSHVESKIDLYANELAIIILRTKRHS